MKKTAYLFILAFGLNFAWEVSQSFLYAPHYVGVSGLLTVHLAAALGDTAIIFILLLLDALVCRYIFSGNTFKRAKLLVIPLAGLGMAWLVERYALATGHWAYNSMMPIIPLLNVGVTPLLQMALIPAGILIFQARLKEYKRPLR